MVLSTRISVEQVTDNLKRLRQGQGLARPTVVLEVLDDAVRQHLCRGHAYEPGSAEEIATVTAAITAAIGRLSETERLYARVDFNLVPDHRYPTLTDRQESLARQQRCATKTIRRHGGQALQTLAYLLLTPAADAPAAALDMPARSTDVTAASGLASFWRLEQGVRIDIVCSEIPPDERPDYADPSDRNYLRYAKFADLDTLIYVRTRLAQLAPNTVVRDFAPSEHYDTHADVLIVIGGPPWNAKYREFLPQLPFHFEPHPLGEDDPLVVPALDYMILAPRWTSRGELIEDLAVFTRLTVQGTTVFLLGGCLTLGVLGAARTLLDPARGPANAGYLRDRVGEDDFVLIAESRRVGGITDTADLTVVEPLLLLTRRTGDDFGIDIDNTKRFTRRHIPRQAR
ncbi:hypothetical protein [Nocardia pulmonis]|nr:hypothetical protein [Nocardia pulmonis]